MNSIRLKLNDIKDIRRVRPRHIIQSIIIFTCFCALDTIKTTQSIWIISAAAAVAAIVLFMLVAGRVRIGRWSNALNAFGALFCLGCYFTSYAFPPAIFFITLTAGIRILHAREHLNDTSTLIFILISVFLGIVLRVLLLRLPVWTLAILMLTTLYNPTIEKKNSHHAQLDNKASLNAEPSSLEGVIPSPLVVMVSIVLVLFFLSIEIFGAPLTDEVSHNFLLQLNIAYLCGYLLFIAAVIFFRIKLTSVIALMLAVMGLFFFLIPTTTQFGIYFLLFLGGGIKVLMLALPITILGGKRKNLGALSGVLVYRLAFLASGVARAIAGEGWEIDSTFTYSLAGVGIILSIILIVLLGGWDRLELKERVRRESVTIKEVIREVPIERRSLPDDLSEQERRVAELILCGRSYREIAEEMLVAMGTVSKYAARIFIKAGVDGQKQFIAFYTLQKDE